VALFVGTQMRRLIVGFSVDEEMRTAVRSTWRDHGFDVLHLIAVWTGPHKVMLAVKVKPPQDAKDVASLVERINAAEKAVRAALPDVAFSFVEPDVVD